jgi:molybdate/tungstate transport system ATP-binding protein
MIEVEDLNIRLPGFSVTGVNLLIRTGEFFALIGPTGAGKTLILEAIGGIVPVTGGRIRIDARDVTRLPPERRNVGIVYQDCALFPHLSVHKNIVYGLRYQRKNTEGPQAVLARLKTLLNLDHLMHRFPENLSGGEKQRVALARALYVQPSVLLLDEPLSSLDPMFRDEIRRLLKSIHQKVGITFFMITHDFAELAFLADRAAIVDGGTILQQGPVDELFRRPVNHFAAQFVGMKNVFAAQFDGLRATVDGLEIKFDGRYVGSPKYVAIHPEDIALTRATSSPGEVNSFEGAVTGYIDKGQYCEVSVAAGALTFAVLTTKRSIMRLRLASGDSVRLGIPPSSVHVF